LLKKNLKKKHKGGLFESIHNDNDDYDEEKLKFLKNN
jgi:hypothetical protein